MALLQSTKPLEVPFQLNRSGYKGFSLPWRWLAVSEKPKPEDSDRSKADKLKRSLTLYLLLVFLSWDRDISKSIHCLKLGNQSNPKCHCIDATVSCTFCSSKPGKQPHRLYKWLLAHRPLGSTVVCNQALQGKPQLSALCSADLHMPIRSAHWGKKMTKRHHVKDQKLFDK